MIQLKLKTSLCGDNFAHARGDEVDWHDDADAVRLIDAGHANPLNDAAKAAYKHAKKEFADRKPAPVKPHPAGRPKPNATPETPPTADPRDNATPVAELDLDDTTIKTLVEAGLTTVGQVTAHPDLTQLNGVGKATATKILQAAASA